MIKKTNILANILFLTYIMVLMHNIFPHHHHGDSGSANCHIENHDDDNHSHGNNILSFLTFHQEKGHEDETLICHFSDSFSKSNLTNDFISSCSLSGVRFFADISTLHFKQNRLNLVHSYYNPLSSRAPPIV